MVLGTELKIVRVGSKVFYLLSHLSYPRRLFFTPGTVARTLQVTLSNSSQGTSYYLHSLFINEVLFKVIVLHSHKETEPVSIFLPLNVSVFSFSMMLQSKIHL